MAQDARIGPQFPPMPLHELLMEMEANRRMPGAPDLSEGQAIPPELLELLQLVQQLQREGITDVDSASGRPMAKPGTIGPAFNDPLNPLSLPAGPSGPLGGGLGGGPSEASTALPIPESGDRLSRGVVGLSDMLRSARGSNDPLNPLGLPGGVLDPSRDAPPPAVGSPALFQAEDPNARMPADPSRNGPYGLYHFVEAAPPYLPQELLRTGTGATKTAPDPSGITAAAAALSQDPGVENEVPTDFISAITGVTENRPSTLGVRQAPELEGAPDLSAVLAGEAMAPSGPSAMGQFGSAFMSGLVKNIVPAAAAWASSHTGDPAFQRAYEAQASNKLLERRIEIEEVEATASLLLQGQQLQNTMDEIQLGRLKTAGEFATQASALQANSSLDPAAYVRGIQMIAALYAAAVGGDPQEFVNAYPIDMGARYGLLQENLNSALNLHGDEAHTEGAAIVPNPWFPGDPSKYFTVETASFLLGAFREDGSVMLPTGAIDAANMRSYITRDESGTEVETVTHVANMADRPQVRRQAPNISTSFLQDELANIIPVRRDPRTGDVAAGSPDELAGLRPLRGTIMDTLTDANALAAMNAQTGGVMGGTAEEVRANMVSFLESIGVVGIDEATILGALNNPEMNRRFILYMQEGG